jgi:hypothetical protein
MGKWFTFAPCNFGANEGFFWRDTGLLCRGLQQLGHESKVILLGPAFEGDLPGIVRAEKLELESADWWRALELDGVIMMAWGRHRETPMVRAIAASGTPLVLHIDGSGNGFPLFDQIETLKTFWRAERGTGRVWPSRCAGFVTTATTQGVKLLLRHTYLKYRHLRYPTVVTLQTPTSLERHQRLCSFFGGKNHGIRLKLAGCHIPSTFEWNPSVAKEKRIISIGRWEDLKQKRAYVLMPVCAAIARSHPDLEIDIFGTRTEALANWHSGLEPGLQGRIHLHGVQPGPVVFQAAQKAQISFFPSSQESLLLALFETLACGASTVGLDSPDLPGTRWAADSQHADLAECDTTEAFVAALDRGLRKWERGEYSARQISGFWVPRTRVERVLGIMLDAVTEAKG